MRFGQFIHWDARQQVGELIERAGRHADAGQDCAAAEDAVGRDEIDGDGAAGVDDDGGARGSRRRLAAAAPARRSMPT